MKRLAIIILCALTAIAASAQTPDRDTDGIWFSVRSDSKLIFQNGGSRYSVGYSSTLAYRVKDISAGVGFDTATASRWMSTYSCYINGNVSYAFRSRLVDLVPAVKAGWFFEADPKCSSPKYRYDYFQAQAGANVCIKMTKDIHLTLTALYLVDNTLRQGFSLGVGFKGHLRTKNQ